jgi:hypothetical protein
MPVNRAILDYCAARRVGAAVVIGIDITIVVIGQEDRP